MAHIQEITTQLKLHISKIAHIQERREGRGTPFFLREREEELLTGTAAVVEAGERAAEPSTEPRCGRPRPARTAPPLHHRRAEAAQTTGRGRGRRGRAGVQEVVESVKSGEMELEA
jgi:hypothetical protein